MFLRNTPLYSLVNEAFITDTDCILFPRRALIITSQTREEEEEEEEGVELSKPHSLDNAMAQLISSFLRFWEITGSWPVGRHRVGGPKR